MSHKAINEDPIMRATGLLIIEVINSNPNGNPDREGEPRQRPNELGELSPVSLKRKVRDLVENKEGPVWKHAVASLNPKPNSEEFGILESRKRERSAIIQESKSGQLIQKYWDARIFGCTFLEKADKDEKGKRGTNHKKNDPSFVQTGVVQFGVGVSVAPISILRMTTTNPPVQGDKSRGMAPSAYRVVQHGVYCMPFFVNPTAATKSGCQKRDIDLLLKIIPYAYTHTASYVRPFVNIRHAWYMEHKSPLGSCSDFELINALTPRKKTAPNEPSTSWEDYHFPNYDDNMVPTLPEDLKKRIAIIRDLMMGDKDGAASSR